MVAINKVHPLTTFGPTSQLRQSRSPDQSEAFVQEIAQRRPPRKSEKAPKSQSQQACPPQKQLSFPEVRRERDHLVDLDKRLSEDNPPRSQKELDALVDKIRCRDSRIANIRASLPRLVEMSGLASDDYSLRELEKVENDLSKLGQPYQGLGRLLALRQSSASIEELPTTLEEARKVADDLRRQSDDVDILFARYERKSTHSQKEVDALARELSRLDGTYGRAEGVERLMEEVPDDQSKLKSEFNEVRDDLLRLYGKNLVQLSRLGYLQVQLREEALRREQSVTPKTRR